ncbi:MAG TPA: response regulator [Polyangiaceae bacterium]
MLQRAGLRVVECNNGHQALSWLVDGGDLPDVIVLDLAMPVMSGRELLAVIRNYVRLARLPIIIVTGTTEALPAEPPIVAYLSKPVEPQTLIRSVREAMA